MSFRDLPVLSIAFEPAEHLDVVRYVIKPVLVDALGVSLDQLKGLVIDETTAGLRAGEAAPDIPETVFKAIRESSFVICDTTGNRPNCYLELGYAMGYGKKVLILHRSDSKPPAFNIRGRPIIYYRGYSELREKLVAAIRDNHLDAPPDAVHDLEDFFRRCSLPVVPLDGDGRYQYRISRAAAPISSDTVSTQPFVPPEPWATRFREALDAHLAKAGRDGNTLYNGQLARVVDYIPLRDDTDRARYLRLHVQATDYYTFVSSNFGDEFLSESHREELWRLEKENFRDLRHSLLANPLTVNLSVVVRHRAQEWILIQERNTAKVSHAGRRFHASCAGMVNRLRDVGAAGLDPFQAARNELLEELGLAVNDSDLEFLALVRETEHGEVGLVGEAVFDANPSDLLKPAADTFESRRVLVCELTPPAVHGFIRSHGDIGAFSGLGLAAIVFSLLKRFPSNLIESYFRRTHD